MDWISIILAALVPLVLALMGWITHRLAEAREGLVSKDIRRINEIERCLYQMHEARRGYGISEYRIEGEKQVRTQIFERNVNVDKMRHEVENLGVTHHSLVCPRCGAPIDPHSSKCEYCGVYWKEPDHNASIKMPDVETVRFFSNDAWSWSLENIK